ncbi:PIR Superfamily Protein [Plasmodium ovale curtisi]|uniref:PIR Superfamily Protein n=1 Tax=Plasmodium ovale curtisi TaxID=864141 RepID=A0A1A8WC15_PLAOA|nr:PIR Superfamily Protein [Plasmodium ovale curtisi]
MTNEKNTELCNSNNECDELKRRHPYQCIDKLCRKLENNLKVICAKDNSDGFLNYLFEYLHYWLLDKAIQTFNIIESRKLKYETVCKPLSDLYFPHFLKDFNNEKYMYNFYYNYKYFEMKKSLTDNESKEYFLENNGQVERLVLGKPGGIMSSTGLQSEDEERSGLDTSVHYPETTISAMGVGFALFGLLIISFILLKFTPVGSWFYNRMIKKGKHAENLDEEASNELSNHYFVTEELKSQGKGFSVSYNTLQNIE